MRTRFYSLEENSKIMNIIEKQFNATSPATAVSLDMVISKGIEMGVAETYPRGGHDGHPWYPRTAVMMGVGSQSAVEANEEKHLHRAKMHKGGRAKLYYWVDRTYEHETVARGGNAVDSKGAKVKNETKTILEDIRSRESRIPAGTENLPAREKFEVYETYYPGTTMLVTDIRTLVERVVRIDWILSHPEKAKSIYNVEI